MGQRLGIGRRLRQRVGRKAGLGLLAADVDLQQDILRQLHPGGHLLDLVQQLRGAHRLDQHRLAHHLLHLVALQVANEVQRRAVIGVFLQLFRHLLHPVFAQRVDTGGDGLLTPGGVVHLAGAHQRDILAGAARLAGSRVDLLPDVCNIFRNRHGRISPFYVIACPIAFYPITLPSNSSAVVTMTSSPRRSMLESSSAEAADTST